MTGRKRLAAALVALAIVAAAGLSTPQPSAPSYLSYVEFAPGDTAEQLALKRAYNDAVQRYNRALYDYHVTLEKHDRLVELHNNGPATPEARKQAREEAGPLRVKLTALRREVTARAADVDQAARRAAASGVTLTR